MKESVERRRLIRGITLCPDCYEVGKHSPLIYDREGGKIFCHTRQHEWVAEKWIEARKGWKK